MFSPWQKQQVYILHFVQGGVHSTLHCVQDVCTAVVQTKLPVSWKTGALPPTTNRCQL